MNIGAHRPLTAVYSALLLAVCPVGVMAQDMPPVSTYGTPGLIDMPTAETLEDGLVLPTLSFTGGILKQTLTFQITPRMTGSFRYAVLNGFDGQFGNRYDRSFDFAYQFWKETDHRPAVSVGLRDFGGTGIYSSEYVVATKHFGDRLGVTAGIGWGRLAGIGAFDNPLGALSDRFDSRGAGPTNINEVGRLEADKWFRGDAAFFGGLSYKITDRLTFAAEYSSDAYLAETARIGFEHKTPVNVALNYRLDSGTQIGGYILNGSQAGVTLAFPLHPDRPSMPGGLSDAPPAIFPQNAEAAASWDLAGNRQAQFAQALDAQGIKLEGFEMSGAQATVRIRNAKYSADAQALGRTGRIMANMMPASIESFRIVLSKQGMPVSSTTLRRSDMVALEHDLDGSWKSFARAEITDAAGRTPSRLKGSYPSLSYGLTPYLQPSLFDPDNPFRLDAGLQLAASVNLLPGFVISGAVRQPLAGNLDDITRQSNSILPHVRSDAGRYAVEADTELKYLTTEYFTRLGESFYGRLTAGYLETMYGGVSGEVLWYPTDSRLALGAELNYVRQRDFNQLFGFQDYKIATGHASAYYDFGDGVLGQVDAGRYLAKDWGATVSLDREFDNGFKVGAFFTITDVPFDDFGEGSFDKGIRFTVPVSWLSGDPTQAKFGTTIRPVLRDGGARLDVRNRLFGLVRDAQTNELEDQWGVFWR